MRKLLISGFCLMLVLMMSVSALAEVPTLNDQMISYAKATISCLASGDYDRIVTGLPYSGVAPSADEWRSYAEGNFYSLAGAQPQQKYGVAYWTGSYWKIVVPATEPADGSVECLVLVSEDGSTISGYAFADWGQVSSEYSSAEYVIWNDEYVNSSSVIVQSDFQ